MKPTLKPILLLVVAAIAGFSLYQYHPKQTGTAFSPTAAEAFRNLSPQEQYAWMEEHAKSDGPETVWTYLQAAYNTPQGVIGNPHDLAHFAGKLLFKKYGFDGLTFCNPTFAFGCYHGLMQTAFDPDLPEKFPKALTDAQVGCAAANPSTSPSYWSCIHGIGHGVATFRNYDLSPALKDCDTLGESIRTYCHDGVFMEFSRNAPADFYKKSDPIYPCDAIDPIYRTGCARNQVQVMKQKFNFSNPQIALACLKSDDSQIKYHCIDAIGYAVAQESGGSAEKVIAGCNALPESAASAQCLAAAAGELVFQDTLGWEASSARICTSLKADASCQARIDSVAKSYGRK